MDLTNFGIYNPLLKGEQIKKYKEVKQMADKEYKEATSGDVIKFEKEGDSIEGKFLGYEESKQFSSSYALKVETKDGVKVVFVSGIVIDLIENNSIKKGQDIKLEFLGMKTSEKSGREYKDYKLLFR